MSNLAPEVDLRTPFCLTAEGIKTREDLFHAAGCVAPGLDNHDGVCNLIRDRFGFAAVLLAAMWRGVVTRLPSSRAEAAIESALEGLSAPRVIETLTGNTAEAAEGVLCEHPNGGVEIFTSGSTGTPVRHAKSWDMLMEGARPAVSLLSDAGLVPGTCLIAGTTPHQHMYGLEASLFTGLAHGYCLYDRTVFYPADLEAVCADAREHGFDAVALISSPPHLAYLAETIERLPLVRCVISATAPLHLDLARRIEAGATAQVYEIYGSTETGSFATRRPTVDMLWTPFPGGQLVEGPDGWHAVTTLSGQPIPIADTVRVRPDGRFELLGRVTDMVRVAGKRQSLGALNAVLATAEGISDGVVLCERGPVEDRLHVLVVTDLAAETAQDQLRAGVRAHLLDHLDPVFVPRRVHLIDRLPRNETGKIPKEGEARLFAWLEGQVAPIRRRSAP